MGDRARSTCHTCGAWLASDHADAVCTPCQRAKLDGAADIPALPEDFWNREDVRIALADRHFGRLLLILRKVAAPELTQAAIGRLLGLTQGQVSRIERSDRAVHDLQKLDHWARRLGIPENRLWFSLSRQPADACASSDDSPIVQASDPAEGDEVHRRQFIKSTVGLTAVGASLLARRPMPHPGRRTLRGAPHPSVEIREMTQVFRRLDNRYGGGHSRSVVASYLNSAVTPLLKQDTETGSRRSDLFAAAAELHHLAGWMAYDTGQHAEGHVHLRQALRLCHEANDEALASEMLAGMSHQAAFHGAPDAAVDLAIAAQHSAKRAGSKVLQSESAVMEAHGLALQGDKAGCMAALSAAEDAFNRSDAEERPAWLNYFDHAYLAAKFAHAFRDLGLPREAEPFARRSLEMSDGYERGRLFNTALLATTLADQRRLEESCALGMQATALGASVRSVRGTTYLEDLGERLAPYHGVPVVKSLFESMIEIGVSPHD